MEIQFKGHTIYIDKEDYHYLEEVNFCIDTPKGGRYLRNTTKNIMLHRLIMNCPKDKQVDHINGNGLDNRKCNLRICSRSENQRNQHKIWGTSKYRGVYWNKKAKKWQARITLNGKEKNLGLFENEKEAGKIYNFVAKRHYGEFANLNQFN